MDRLSTEPKVENFKENQVSIAKRIAIHWQLYLLLLPPVAYLIVFKYLPMYGVQIAFKDFNAGLGIAGSPWTGWKYFKLFFKSPNFGRLLWNTFSISLYSIAAGFPIPIIFAISLNECKHRFFNRTVQMVAYAPYFISTVILVGILLRILSPSGLINNVRTIFGHEIINYMGETQLFKSIYVWSGVWQATGYNSVIYLAALAGISPELYEAARVDGANTLQKIWHVDLPGIMPTATILLILSSASILSVGFEKIYLMQNPLNMSVSDVIQTYVYRIGLVSAQYSYSSAIGLFNSVVSVTVLVLVNNLAKRISETTLW